MVPVPLARVISVAFVYGVATTRTISALQSPGILQRFLKNTSLQHRTISATTALFMVRGVKKEHLPEKICVICHRPFTWRKKWEDCWDEVTTCSKSCNRTRRAQKQAENRSARNDTCGEQSSEKTGSDNRTTRSVGRKPSKEREQAESSSSSSSVLSATTSAQEDVGEQVRALETDQDTARLILESTDFVENLVADTGDANHDVVDEDNNDPKAARKLAKKQMKALRRLKRQGLAPEVGQKSCHLCQSNVDLLIRCTIDESEEWKMVCGMCWRSVSGGVVDGDAEHPHYRYGGLWKNRLRRS